MENLRNRSGSLREGARNKRSTSLVNSLLSTGPGSARSRGSTGNGNSIDVSGPSTGMSHGNLGNRKHRGTMARETMREQHAKELVVKFRETVDGGFLAPYGCYGFEKLDYDASVVKSLITRRELAPFYTPLQDYDEDWTREELLKIVDGLPLHAPFDSILEEYEDVPTGNLQNPDFEYLIDRSLPKGEQRKMRSRIFKARLYKKRIMWQESENNEYLDVKFAKQSVNVSRQTKDVKLDPAMESLPSDDLKFCMYSEGLECPICFLYMPGPMNYSHCCQQPICTECFVQIKRADPHFPHDEVDPTKPVTENNDKDPKLLISEPSNCPYCATPNFAVKYTPPSNRRTGILGSVPAKFVSTEQKVVKPSSHVNSVTSDDLRPNWDYKLKKERSRLARREANATAIHVSNRLVDITHPSNSASNADNSGTDTTMMDESTNTDSQRSKTAAQYVTIAEMEKHMLDQAIKLSLQEEESKKNKGRNQ